MGFVGRLALGCGQGQELVAQGLDLPLDGGGVERGMRTFLVSQLALLTCGMADPTLAV